MRTTTTTKRDDVAGSETPSGSAFPSSPPGRAKRALPACRVCEKSRPALPPGREGHDACWNAYGLDYDPKSEADAREWLARRLAALNALTRGSVRP